MSAIKLAGVGHRYGDTQALKDAALTLEAGQSLGIIGPDGVGKSTLLDLIAGTKALQQGQLEVLGADMTSARARRNVCADIAYMPQGLGKNLYPTLSVWENLDFFGRLFGHGQAERRRRAEQLLKATHLWPFKDRPAGKLSGGMKQKLGLCCALIHDPKLLLLDEPTTGVDPLSRRQFWQLVASIRQARPQMSLVVATAYMEEAMVLDSVMALDGGRILAKDSPQELLARTGTQDLDAAFIALQAGGAGQPFQPLPLATGGDRPVAIQAKGLTCRFGDFTAVSQVSLTIGQGEIFGFLGSNGCGKTTTMKMLTGLLPPSEGQAAIFGEPVTQHSLAMRAQVGYMTQAFSLYGELTVRANLELHAKLYDISEPAKRIGELLARFTLEKVADKNADALPLGIKQRLQLAVAVLHRPRLLILDEPTSGVDPQARDQFWTLLHELSRHDRVTIFISTHFMNEAGRCDRISLMHAGHILAQGTPAQLVKDSQAQDLEGAFIHYLEQAQPSEASGELPVGEEKASAPPAAFSFGRLWAYARREGMEIKRDPIRLAFAMLGTVLLMVVFGFGISFDVENLAYGVFDQDQSPQSRAYVESFRGSRYFEEKAPIQSEQEAQRRLKSGELRLVLAIGPGFGRDLAAGRQPEVAAWIDGAMPFRGETARGYVLGVHQQYLKEQGLVGTSNLSIQSRYRYNQDFRSVNAMVPGVLMLLLALIPAILTALAVVREKEMGSILNLYATPTTRLEFLLGKQLPYILIACINALSMLLLAIWLFQVPVTGSLAALLLGSLLYVTATTAFGLLVSAFVKTQVAALFASAILSIMPAVNFSGLIVPMASMTGAAKWMGLVFPSAYFNTLSVGTFAKGLGLVDLVPSLLALAGFALGFVVLSVLVMKEQEK